MKHVYTPRMETAETELAWFDLATHEQAATDKLIRRQLAEAHRVKRSRKRSYHSKAPVWSK